VDTLDGPAMTANKQNHVTKSLNEYDLITFLKHKHKASFPLDKFRMKFFDTWGVTTENWDVAKDFSIVRCLKGTVKPGFSMDEVETYGNVKSELEKEAMNAYSDEDRVMHVLLIVIPRAFQGEEEDLKIRLRANIDAAVDLGYTPIVVVTRMDEVAKNNMSEQDLKEQVMKLTGAAISDIYLHCNYNKEKKKEFPRLITVQERYCWQLKKEARALRACLKRKRAQKNGATYN